MLSLLAVVDSSLMTAWPWYVSRASGILASILLIMLLVTGIGAFTGYSFKYLEPLKAWANHRVLGIAFTISILVHIVSIYFDSYVNFGLSQLLIPFVSTYKSIVLGGVAIGSLGVALGIISLYLVIAIMFTSLTKIIDKNKRAWKTTHYLSYILIVATLFHSIMIGTDFKSVLLRSIWIGSNLLILGILISIRLKRRGSLNPGSTSNKLQS